MKAAENGIWEAIVNSPAGTQEKEKQMWEIDGMQDRMNEVVIRIGEDSEDSESDDEDDFEVSHTFLMILKIVLKS